MPASDAPIAAALDGVAETLLIPLAARAFGAARFPRLGFSDPASQAAAARVRFDAARCLSDAAIVFGILRRTQLFTALARDFLARHPDGMGMALGAGLSSYFARLDDGRLDWVDLDLPPVADLRARVWPAAAARHRVVAGSLLDDSWLATVRRDRPTVFLCEGVLNYFEPAQVRRFLQQWAAHVHPASELLVDAACWLVVGKAHVHRMLRHFDAEFRWGPRRLGDLAAADPRLELRAATGVLERRTWAHRAGLRLFQALTGVPFYAIYRLGLRPPPAPTATGSVR